MSTTNAAAQAAIDSAVRATGRMVAEILAELRSSAPDSYRALAALLEQGADIEVAYLLAEDGGRIGLRAVLPSGARHEFAHVPVANVPRPGRIH